MITYEDWRDAPVAVVGALYEAECARWETGLGWDYRPACVLVESARREGRLPGVLAREGGGAVVGWSYFVLQSGRLHIGNLVAGTPKVTRGLLSAVLRSPEGRDADAACCFIYGAAGLDAALGSYHFAVVHHAYLRRRLSPAGDEPICGSPNQHARYRVADWSSARVPQVAQLLNAAYANRPESRCFARPNRLDQWLEYVGHIHAGAVCGRLCGRMSALVVAPDGTPAGAVIVTQLSGPTAHIAQIAVAPEHRGAGLGEYLVRLACARARESGYEWMTLLVAETNTPARRLYHRLGFEVVDRFVFADRDSGPP